MLFRTPVGEYKNYSETRKEWELWLLKLDGDVLFTYFLETEGAWTMREPGESSLLAQVRTIRDEILRRLMLAESIR